MTDRFKELKIDYDDRTVFVARVSRLPSGRLEFDSFDVITHIGGIDYPVTKALNEETLGHFKGYFELEVSMKYTDMLGAVADATHDWDEPGVGA